MNREVAVSRAVNAQWWAGYWFAMSEVSRASCGIVSRSDQVADFFHVGYSLIIRCYRPPKDNEQKGELAHL